MFLVKHGIQAMKSHLEVWGYQGVKKVAEAETRLREEAPERLPLPLTPSPIQSLLT